MPKEKRGQSVRRDEINLQLARKRKKYGGMMGMGLRRMALHPDGACKERRGERGDPLGRRRLSKLGGGDGYPLRYPSQP